VHRAQLADEREQGQYMEMTTPPTHARTTIMMARERSQVFHRRVNFFFVEISDFLEHGVHCAVCSPTQSSE